MKKLITAILIVVSLSSFGQGNAVKEADTAAIRKEQEAITKFVSDLVSKTSIKDFRAWLYESNAGVKDFEAFNKLYNAFIQQKYLATKSKNK